VPTPVVTPTPTVAPTPVPAPADSTETGGDNANIPVAPVAKPADISDIPVAPPAAPAPAPAKITQQPVPPRAVEEPPPSATSPDANIPVAPIAKVSDYASGDGPAATNGAPAAPKVPDNSNGSFP